MSDVLKPCPFCGGEASIFYRSKGFWAYCTNDDCGGEVNGYRSKDDAIAAWNRRTIPTIPVLGKIGDERPASIADHSSDH